MFNSNFCVQLNRSRSRKWSLILILWLFLPMFNPAFCLLEFGHTKKTMFISLFMPLVLLYCRIKLRRSLVLEDRNVADAILPLQDRFIFLLWHSIAVRMTRRLTLDQSLFNGHLFTDMGRIKTVQIFTDIYKFPSLNKVF